MKVKDLIAALTRYDGDSDVHLAFPAGDYWHTMLAPAVRRVEMADVEHSGYHRCDKLITEDQTADEESRTVVVLR